jgi:hypothetical protein
LTFPKGINESLAVEYGFEDHRVRVAHNLASMGTGVEFGVHNADVRTTLRGLLTRVFYHKVEGTWQRPQDPGFPTVHAILKKSRNALLRLTYPVAPYSYDQFVGCYVGRKRLVYEQAVESLLVRDVEQKDAFLQTFVKAEKLNLSAKPDPDPRVIQPRSPRYNAAVGVYIKACEKMIYRAIDRLWGRTTVMKGLNASERGRAILKVWNSFEKPVAVGADASRFDEHVKAGLLLMEHSVYKAIFRSKRLARLLSWQINNRGFARCADGDIKYKVWGSRMSGDMNTSLGNVLLMSLMMHAYAQTKSFDIALINDGDDCVLVCESRFADQLGDMSDWFRQLGMVMVTEEPVYELEKLVFCQAQPVWVDGVYRMVRDPRVCLDKDLVTLRPIRSEKDWRYHRRAIAQCGLALAGDMPVYGEFYSALLRGTSHLDSISCRGGARQDVLDSGVSYLAQRMVTRYSGPSAASRVSFWKAFGITPDMQESIEALYAKHQCVWGEKVHVLKFGELIAGTF